MKKSLSLAVLTLVCLFSIRESLAQVHFGLTSVVETNKFFLVVDNPAGLSYTFEWSTNGSSWSAAPGFATTYGNKPARVQLNPPVPGYYRATAYSNGVPYTSTNSPLVYSLKASTSGGNRQIQVVGLPSLTYAIEGSTNLVNWTNVFTGTLGQTNFVDPLILPRFYRAKTQ
ncbi:MAG: hypothetical protein WC250_02610 [Candidatus Paceibacterota bacterium]|jgi:hypothetical protein